MGAAGTGAPKRSDESSTEWVARADDAGKLTIVTQVATQNGARDGVVTTDGTVFLAHGGGVKVPALVVVSPVK